MSNQKRGRPTATSPEPPIRAKTESTESPKAAAPIKITPPPTPAIVRGLAFAVQRKWGVPPWLTKLASWTGSKFHTQTLGTNNACGIKAYGTMQRNETGWAWFGNIPISYDQFGAICRDLNFDHPEKCVEAIKDKCPNIDIMFIKHFIAEA